MAGQSCTDKCEATELINGKLIFSLLIFGALPTLVFSTIRIDFHPGNDH